MNKIIAIIFLFIAAQGCAQIDPYQIIKDSLGAHRILLTDSTGEYTRVLLRDAIADSIGIGKFVNGTDPLDAVYMDGNVGIGTTSPALIFSSSGMQIKAGDSAGLRLTDTTGANFEISARSGDVLLYSTSVGKDIRIGAGNAERMRIKSTGEVGVGTMNPDKLFVVSGDDAQVVINDTHTTDTPRLRFRESGATSGSIYTDNKELIFDSGTTEKMRIDTDGNVGIGTNNPSSNLEISDLQNRLALTSTKDGSWVSGSYMNEILFKSEDTSGAAGASTRASIRTEAVDAGGSPVADGSDVQLVFKIKGDVAGLPPDAMILHSNKDLEILGGLEVAERTGTANKSAFFDTDGKLVEGDLVSGGQSVTCKIETTSNQTISATGSPFVVFDSQTIDNGSLSSDLTNNKITINEDGLYMILFYMKLKGGNGAEFDVEIDVNGSAKEDHYQTLDSDDLMTVSGSHVGSFSDGDDVKIQIGQVTVDSGQAVETIYTGSSLTVIRL